MSSPSTSPVSTPNNGRSFTPISTFAPGATTAPALPSSLVSPLIHTGRQRPHTAPSPSPPSRKYSSLDDSTFSSRSTTPAQGAQIAACAAATDGDRSTQHEAPPAISWPVRALLTPRSAPRSEAPTRPKAESGGYRSSPLDASPCSHHALPAQPRPGLRKSPTRPASHPAATRCALSQRRRWAGLVSARLRPGQPSTAQAIRADHRPRRPLG